MNVDAVQPRKPRPKFPPGPRARFPGQILFNFRHDVLGYLTQVTQTYGDAVHFKPLLKDFFVFTHPDAVCEVVIAKERSFIKGPALRRAQDMLGNGLLISEGEFHHRQRRLAQPALHAQRVNSYAAAMTDLALQMRAAWRDGRTIDLHEQMMQYTLAVVARTLFGAEITGEVDQIAAAMHTSVRMFQRAMVPFGEYLNYLPLPSNYRFVAARKRLMLVIDGFIARRRVAARGGEVSDDLLSLLLRAVDTGGAGGTMSDRQLRDECITLFTAGHETTANALTFAWYLLAQNPNCEAALHREIAENLGDRPPAAEDVAHLSYTRAVIAESMRLFPPAWALGREAVEEVEIGGWRMPRGAIVLLSQWVTHRDPRWWPQPLEFHPDRWLGDATESRPRYAYFPFGGGQRSCIGEAFAWLEATLALATFAQHWRLELAQSPPIPLLASITLRPRHGLKMKLRRRS